MEIAVLVKHYTSTWAYYQCSLTEYAQVRASMNIFFLILKPLGFQEEQVRLLFSPVAVISISIPNHLQMRNLSRWHADSQSGSFLCAIIMKKKHFLINSTIYLPASKDSLPLTEKLLIGISYKVGSPSIK